MYLLRDSFARLRQEADKHDVPYAQLICEAVDYYLDEKVAKKPKRKINWTERAKKASVGMGGKDDSNHLNAIKDVDLVFNKENVVWITEHILDEITTIFVKRKYKQQLPLFMDRIYSG